MSMPIMPNTIAEQDKTANAIGTKYLMPNDLENTIIDSILNDESLSMDQKRRLLEERIANLPPKQREKLENLKHMSELGYLFLTINPVLAQRIPQAQWGEIGAKITKQAKQPLIKNAHGLGKWIWEGLGEGALEIRNSIIQEVLKEGATQTWEGVKETAKDLEWETRKLLSPKIPYIDY